MLDLNSYHFLSEILKKYVKIFRSNNLKAEAFFSDTLIICMS